MRCQMLCGRCRNDATLVLHTDGKPMSVIDLGSLGVREVPTKKRDVFACAKHRRQLETCQGSYGGRIEVLK